MYLLPHVITVDPIYCEAFMYVLIICLLRTPQIFTSYVYCESYVNPMYLLPHGIPVDPIHCEFVDT